MDDYSSSILTGQKRLLCYSKDELSRPSHKKHKCSRTLFISTIPFLREETTTSFTFQYAQNVIDYAQSIRFPWVTLSRSENNELGPKYLVTSTYKFVNEHWIIGTFEEPLTARNLLQQVDLGPMEGSEDGTWYTSNIDVTRENVHSILSRVKDTHRHCMPLLMKYLPESLVNMVFKSLFGNYLLDTPYF